ncbi:unnamed protein product [Vicia faba]|uniref:Uncharacterized protein n=1 Tax=Vicia faba TaxID=3906 RepID=A0AAV1ABY5_VICFA|nr:unnamed protein product [Vicia faba]
MEKGLFILQNHSLSKIRIDLPHSPITEESPSNPLNFLYFIIFINSSFGLKSRQEEDCENLANPRHIHLLTICKNATNSTKMNSQPSSFFNRITNLRLSSTITASAPLLWHCSSSASQHHYSFIIIIHDLLRQQRSHPPSLHQKFETTTQINIINLVYRHQSASRSYRHHRS